MGSYACPDQLIETGRINKYFYMQKIFKTGVILW